MSKRFRIETVTIFAAIDNDNGSEGVMGFQNTEGTWMPLVCADEERIEQMYPVAQQISEATGMQFRVIQFTGRTDVTDIVHIRYQK